VIAGDGDAGLTLKAGGECVQMFSVSIKERNVLISVYLAVLRAIKSGRLTAENAITFVLTVAEIVDEDMGGTSGALYS